MKTLNGFEIRGQNEKPSDFFRERFCAHARGVPFQSKERGLRLSHWADVDENSIIYFIARKGAKRQGWAFLETQGQV